MLELGCELWLQVAPKPKFTRIEREQLNLRTFSENTVYSGIDSQAQMPEGHFRNVPLSDLNLYGELGMYGLWQSSMIPREGIQRKIFDGTQTPEVVQMLERPIHFADAFKNQYT